MNALKFKITILLAIFAIMSFNAQINIGRLKDKAQNVIKKTETVTDRVRQTTGKNVNVKETVSRTIENETGGLLENIWFSKTRDGKAEKNFTSGDNIYAHIKLNKPLGQFLDDAGLDRSGENRLQVSLTYLMNNAQYGEFVTYNVSTDDLAKSELILDVLPGSDAKSQYYMGTYKNHIGRVFNSWDKDGMASEIPFGPQKFTMTFIAEDLFRGSFNFTVKNRQELASVKQRVNAVDQAMDQAIAAQTVLPESFKRSGKYADPALTLANIRKMIQYDGMTILKITIDDNGSSDWNINKDEFGIPLRKVSNKPVWLAYRENGKCFFTKKYFTREYQGGGKYGPVELATSTADVTPIACENIK